MITTHVLDTAAGRPGRGIAIELERSETGGGDPDGSAGGAGGSAPVGSIVTTQAAGTGSAPASPTTTAGCVR